MPKLNVSVGCTLSLYVLSNHLIIVKHEVLTNKWNYYLKSTMNDGVCDCDQSQGDEDQTLTLEQSGATFVFSGRSNQRCSYFPFHLPMFHSPGRVLGCACCIRITSDVKALPHVTISSTISSTTHRRRWMLTLQR